MSTGQRRLPLIDAKIRPISNSVSMLELHRHPLGVRVYVLRRRIHEWHVGFALLAVAALLAFTGRVGPFSWRTLASLLTATIRQSPSRAACCR